MLAKREEDKDQQSSVHFGISRPRGAALTRWNEKKRERKENPRKSAVNEKSFYWWFWKNIDYIKTASAERAGRRGRRRCSRAVLVQVQSLFVNQVWDHVQPGERTSTAGGDGGRKGAGGEVCIVLTEEKDGGEEDPCWRS